ncbi:GerAB/ArcD/ProY family transporter [Ammoniphilus sp. 3BR4]|uniref:GerAB/ArcD/ProY family transporter n=1 Tax=Ammoniphilus sp. 3BR4 TaxID=3158265 RepID=UPI0034651F18
MNKETITVFQLVMIMMTSTGLMNHVIIIPLLLKAAGRDSWISVLLTIIVLLCWVVLIYYIMKKTEQQNMFLWFQHLYRKHPKIWHQYSVKGEFPLDPDSLQSIEVKVKLVSSNKLRIK